MSPRAVAATVAGTIAAITVLLVFGVGLFLLGCVFAALVWVAVVLEQRDDARQTARSDRKAKLRAVNKWLSLLAENLALKAKVASLEAQFAELDQENMALLDVVTEHRLTTDPMMQVPRLRVLPPVASDDDWFARLYDERGNVR